jgi:hypothetical protein
LKIGEICISSRSLRKLGALCGFWIDSEMPLTAKGIQRFRKGRKENWLAEQFFP